MSTNHIIKVRVGENDTPGQAFARCYGPSSDLSYDDQETLINGPAEEDFDAAWANALENVRYFDKVAGRHYKPFIHPKEGLILLGAKAEISCDRDTSSPRIDEDTIAVMFCETSGRERYGDEDAASPFVKVENDDEDADDRFVLRPDIMFCRPIFLYEHSGLAFSHGAFSDAWDSGQIGVHYITREAFAESWPHVDPDSDEAKSVCAHCIREELETYQDWINGNVWRFAIRTLDGASIESANGFIGDLTFGIDSAVECMKQYVDDDLAFLLDQAAEDPTY